MSDSASRSANRTVTVRVPLAFRRRGGRRLVLAPDGSALRAAGARIDNTMVKAIARAFRWKDLLENGQFASVLELAEAEQINQSYLCRVLRLTLLAPALVEAILDGRQSQELTLGTLMKPFPIDWRAQRTVFGAP